MCRQEKREEKHQMNRSTLWKLGWLTLIGFSVLGLLIIYFFQDTTLEEAFTQGWAWYYQVPVGLAYGALTAWLAWQLIESKIMTPVKSYYGEIMMNFELRWTDILFISFCAGAGEEILFRGAIQPFLGIWITSVVFVAIHGYLNPFNWRVSIYGLVMTVVIIGIGYLFEETGIYTAISAHFAIDAVLLSYLVKAEEKKVPPAPVTTQVLDLITEWPSSLITDKPQDNEEEETETPEA